jgi:hypothetical protein
MLHLMLSVHERTVRADEVGIKRSFLGHCMRNRNAYRRLSSRPASAMAVNAAPA